jgi:hypothetical protein
MAQKRNQLFKKWQADGVNILKAVEKNCGLAFPKKAIEEGIEVHLHKWRIEDGDYVGDVTETEPLKLNIYLKKRSDWKSVKSTLTHELIHCIMWQTYYFDFRRNPTLFEDYFADELITCIVEQLALGRKLNRTVCREAFDYALSETNLRLARVEHSRKMTKSLMDFAASYRSRIKGRKSDILGERRRLLQELPSPLPEEL